MSQFGFLEAEFPEKYALAAGAERYALDDPGAAGLYARKTLESIVRWVFKHDRGLPAPVDHQPKLNDFVPPSVFKLDGLLAVQNC